MKITIVHQHVPADAAADERDVLDQVDAIRAALTANGHGVSVLPCTSDLGNMQRKLEILKPDCLFNLVETLGGSGRLIEALATQMGGRLEIGPRDPGSDPPGTLARIVFPLERPQV